FRHINEFEARRDNIFFDYKITYEIEGRITEIEWKAGRFTVDGNERITVGDATPLPDNILVYYSGHNDTVISLVADYEESFKRRIRGADLSDSRYFLGIDSSYKELLLAICLLKPDDNPCRRFISQKLGIGEIGTEVKLILKRPYYANGRGFNVENNDETDRFWRAAGITKEFLDLLLECAAPAPPGERVRTEGYQAGDDKYILYFDTAKIVEKFRGAAPHELFSRFDNLKVLEMIEEISIPLTLTNGEPASTSFFSDGQFQSVYIFAITELFKQRNCLTLLDEPDSFLHPEWQHEFLTQTFEISNAATQTNHTLLSTHSASTISSSDQNVISLFEIDGNSVKVSRVSKSDVITSLSASLISFSESEARLNIQHNLSNTTGPVLFTEGITDEIILETAWKKLFPGVDRPFEIQSAFDCNFLSVLLRRDDFYISNPGRTFFGLFDFDEAYNQWNGLGKTDVETDPSKCLTKKRETSEGYGLLLPVPLGLSIRNQVLNPISGESYKHHSLLTIELLFHDVPGLETHFAEDTERPDNFRKFNSDKVNFACNVVPGLDSAHFEVFRPIFEFVLSKCVLASRSGTTTTAT
ncbi:MAG: AAA family ATPase, partial [Fimbriimonadaceae bacterium]